MAEITKGQIAKNLFLEGYNCCQAVAGAFADEMGLELSTVAKLCSPFGGGIGRMREVCGAVSGMMFVLGMLYGYDDPKANSEKKRVYSEAQQLAERFKEDNGSIICRELLGLTKNSENSPTPSPRTETDYKKRPCPELCRYAADLLEEFIEKHK